MVRLLLIWIAALALAALSAAAAAGSAWKHKRPALALKVWPVNGFAYAEIADDLIVSELGQGKGAPDRLNAGIIEQAADFAAEAYEKEPTSVSAVRTLAMRRNMAGDTSGARQLMRLSSRLSKRDVLANYWLIDDYSRLGEVKVALQLYDQTLRSVGSSRGLLLTIMARALSNPMFIEPYFDLLRSAPPWAGDFWRQAAQTAPSIENAARLRIRLAQAKAHVPAESDELLLNGLTGQYQFATAEALHKLVGPRGPGAIGLLRNADFSSPPGLLPFDWQLISTGEMGAGINAGAGVLEASAIAGSKGVVAQQLVRLSPGRYRIGASFPQEYRLEGGSLYAEIQCAEPNVALAPQRVSLSPARQAAALELASRSCSYFWVRVGLDAAEEGTGMEAILDRLRLDRI